jgi:hypothetical protein
VKLESDNLNVQEALKTLDAPEKICKFMLDVEVQPLLEQSSDSNSWAYHQLLVERAVSIDESYNWLVQLRSISVADHKNNERCLKNSLKCLEKEQRFLKEGVELLKAKQGLFTQTIPIEQAKAAGNKFFDAGYQEAYKNVFEGLRSDRGESDLKDKAFDVVSKNLKALSDAFSAEKKREKISWGD